MDFKSILTSLSTPERALALWGKLRTGGALGTTAETACAGDDSRLTPGAVTNDTALGRDAGGNWVQRTAAQFKSWISLAKGDVGLGNVDDTPDLDKPVSIGQQAAINAAAAATLSAANDAAAASVASEAALRSAADGAIIAALDDKADLVGGKIPSNQLPGFVDDVIEAADFSSLPAEGESGKIYVTLNDNLQYRWSGSIYAQISKSLGIGESAETAYRGDRGKTAYDHSQDTTSNPHAVTKAQVGLGNADNTPDLEKPLSIAAQTALAAKSPLAGSGNIVTVGTVTTGVWQATPINEAYLRAPASGARWQGVPRISSSGEMDCGTRIFFYSTNVATGWSAHIAAQSDSSLFLRPGDGNRTVYLLGSLVPNSANAYYCGGSSQPWAGGYTQTAFTVGSAREIKTNIRDFSDAEKAVAKEIVRRCPRIYQLVTSVAEKGAEAARLHSGCIYEEVYQAFVDGGLDPERYSIFCASPRPKKTSRTESREVITVADGKAVVTTETVTIEEPVFEALPMMDAEGRALLDANGNPRTHRAPVYETDESGAPRMVKGLRYEELQIWTATGLREMAADPDEKMIDAINTLIAAGLMPIPDGWYS